MSPSRALLLLALLFLLAGCGYNSIQSKDESVKAAWSEVVNQYQRRADLVPNLVRTVQGYAEHEEETLTKVTEARASVGRVTLDVTNSEGRHFTFTDASRSVTTSTARAVLACVQYFVKDHPRREWCSAACGNRARVARHYTKRRDHE